MLTFNWWRILPKAFGKPVTFPSETSGRAR